jgi:hypothetical protein
MRNIGRTLVPESLLEVCHGSTPIGRQTLGDVMTEHVYFFTMDEIEANCSIQTFLIAVLINDQIHHES